MITNSSCYLHVFRLSDIPFCLSASESASESNAVVVNDAFSGCTKDSRTFNCGNNSRLAGPMILYSVTVPYDIRSFVLYLKTAPMMMFNNCPVTNRDPVGTPHFRRLAQKTSAHYFRLASFTNLLASFLGKAEDRLDAAVSVLLGRVLSSSPVPEVQALRYMPSPWVYPSGLLVQAAANGAVGGGQGVGMGDEGEVLAIGISQGIITLDGGIPYNLRSRRDDSCLRDRSTRIEWVMVLSISPNGYVLSIFLCLLLPLSVWFLMSVGSVPAPFLGFIAPPVPVAVLRSTFATIRKPESLCPIIVPRATLRKH
ncbi:hypothetical protein V8E54_011878 [Elaphomyces granulatus]